MYTFLLILRSLSVRYDGTGMAAIIIIIVIIIVVVVVSCQSMNQHTRELISARNT